MKTAASKPRNRPAFHRGQKLRAEVRAIIEARPFAALTGKQIHALVVSQRPDVHLRIVQEYAREVREQLETERVRSAQFITETS